MERLKRCFMLFWVVLCVSTIGVAGGLFILRQEEKKVLVSLEESLRVTARTAGAAKERLADEKRRAEVLAEELDEEKRRAEALAEELVEEKQKKEIILTQLEGKDAMINDLLFELEADKKEIVDLRTELEGLQEKLKLVMASREALKKKATGALSKPSEEVSLEKIVIKATPSLQGRILVVNKEFGFVVFDLGKEDGLDVGAILSVYRQDELIAKVQVEKVSEEISAATILPQWKEVEIREDDIVREL